MMCGMILTVISFREKWNDPYCDLFCEEWNDPYCDICFEADAEEKSGMILTVISLNDEADADEDYIKRVTLYEMKS